MENSALNYVNKPPMEAWNVWIWRICAAVSGILSGLALLYHFCAWLIWLAPAGFFFSLLLGAYKPLREYLWRAALFAGCFHGVAISGLLQVADHITLPRWQAGLLVLFMAALCVALLSLLWLAAALIFGLTKPPVPLAFGFWPLACYLIEWLQEHLFHLPAISLGASQGAYPLLCQSAGCWGAAGLSALIVLINVLLAAAFLCKRWRYLILAVAIFAINIISGVVDWHFANPPEQTLVVAAAHSDVAFDQRWDGGYDAEIFAIYAGQAAAAQTAEAQLLLLPETALPYALQAEDGFGARYLLLASRHHLTLLTGGFAEHTDGKYNSLYAAETNGKLTELYQKRALVPFGECSPLPGLLNKLLPQGFWDSFPMEHLQPGGPQGAASLSLPNGQRLKAAPLICYDLCFAAYPRQAVQEGAKLLLAASNDVWYRGTSITYQHLNHAVLRAVEYGRPLINSTNGGYSAIIDEQGRILAAAVGSQAAVAEIALPQHQTIFTRWGQYQIIPVALLWLIVTGVGWMCRPVSIYKPNHSGNYKIYSLR